MGNAGSGVPRERPKQGEAIAASPFRDENQAFNFDKKAEHKLILQHSQEDEEPPSITKQIQARSDNEDQRLAANTLLEDASSSNSITDKTPTVFRWEGGGNAVYICGTFTQWKQIPMVKSHGDFVTIIDLAEGEHQYKYCVDGEWKNDPKSQMIEDEVGAKSNQISVRKSDFEVFQALDKDSESTGNDIQKEYSQDIPTSKPWEKVAGPPVLPPHLLQVILNKDTPLSCEPTLLPEPNHVMLNHLYALSIKDGVMVLSATHRYRKKYVTTLLYKPIEA